MSSVFIPGWLYGVELMAEPDRLAGILGLGPSAGRGRRRQCWGEKRRHAVDLQVRLLSGGKFVPTAIRPTSNHPILRKDMV